MTYAKMNWVILFIGVMQSILATMISSDRSLWIKILFLVVSCLVLIVSVTLQFQTQVRLNQAQDRFDQTQARLNQAQDRFDQTQARLNQAQDRLNRLVRLNERAEEIINMFRVIPFTEG